MLILRECICWSDFVSLVIDLIKWHNVSCNLHSLLFVVRRTADGTGIMFLNEVTLGKEHHITCDDSSLVVAPKGFDSIVARGRQEPG